MYLIRGYPKLFIKKYEFRHIYKIDEKIRFN